MILAVFHIPLALCSVHALSKANTHALFMYAITNFGTHQNLRFYSRQDSATHISV